MDWRQVTAEFEHRGGTFTVARPALLMDIYLQTGSGATYASTLVDRLLTLANDDAQLFYITGNSRAFKPLDKRARRRLLKQLDSLDERGRWYMIKDAPDFALGQFSCEFYLGSTDAHRPDVIYVGLPIEMGSRDRADATSALFEEFIAASPALAATCAFGFEQVWGREYEQVGMPVAFRIALRHQGLTLRDRVEDLDFWERKLKSAGWLTFLGDDFAAPVGGVDALEAKMPTAVTTKRVRDGLLLKAGDAPPVGDVNRADTDTEAMAEVSRAIRTVRLDGWHDPRAFGVDEARANQWLHRFDG
jgi:hypothetical protein